MAKAIMEGLVGGALTCVFGAFIWMVNDEFMRRFL